MNFLALCKRLAQEAGVAGGADAITTVAGVTGEARRIVDWCAGAWSEIQGQRHWTFRWEQPTLTLLAGESTIAAAIPESDYMRGGTWLLQPASAADTWLTFLPWGEFSQVYRRLNTDDNLTCWTVRPDNTLAFNARVTADASILVERFKAPVQLVNDDDAPAIPAHLHMMIVWRALVLYANFDEAGVQRQTAVDEYTALHSQLCNRYLPSIELGGPMIEE
ncbi:MAG: hypothetical protein IIZ92_02150 [Aquincola sp.]|nr:hypothetical protein [Aquincola sp.]